MLYLYKVRLNKHKIISVRMYFTKDSKDVEDTVSLLNDGLHIFSNYDPQIRVPLYLSIKCQTLTKQHPHPHE